MFETALKEKFQRIFDLKKSTFNDPSEEAPEQDTLFIRVEKAVSSIRDTTQLCRVEGRVIVFGQAEKLPFGFFQKKIRNAALEDTTDVFFHDMEANEPLYENIVRRGFQFVYFFNGQYDPDQGTITSIEFETGDE